MTPLASENAAGVGVFVRVGGEDAVHIGGEKQAVGPEMAGQVHADGVPAVDAEPDRLIGQHHYLSNVLLEKKLFPDELNHSDDQLAYVAWYPLLQLDWDPRVRRALHRAVRRHYQTEAAERSSFFNFVTATIDPDGTAVEKTLTNNLVSQTLTFNPVPALDLKLVPINYTHLPTGAYFPGPTTDNESDWLMRGYPLSAVNVSFRPPLEFQGDLSQASEWNRLLSLMASIKNSDSNPSSPFGQVYYGVIPTTNSNGDTYPRAWGGYAAIGWMRAGVGVERASQLAAHEIGHMFGRSHVDCGNPAGPDPNFPYVNGSIGQFGLDVGSSWVYAPDATKDLMSYCGPQWVSDYTYTALYNDQRSKGLLAREIAPGLLIRVNFDDPAQPIIQPVYALTTGITQIGRAHV